MARRCISILPSRGPRDQALPRGRRRDPPSVHTGHGKVCPSSPSQGSALTPDKIKKRTPLRPRVVKRAQFSPHISVRTICRPHSSCVLSTLTFAHHILRLDKRPHTRLTTTTSPFDLTHCPLPYFKMRSSSRPAHRHPSHSHSRSHSHRTPSRSQRRFAFLRAPSAMFSRFNILRASIYCTFCSFLDCRGLMSIVLFVATIALVFLWSVVCLAIAAHFQSVLSASDLSASYLHGRAQRPTTDSFWQLVLYHSQFSYPRQPLPSFSYCACSVSPHASNEG